MNNTYTYSTMSSVVYTGKPYKKKSQKEKDKERWPEIDFVLSEMENRLLNEWTVSLKDLGVDPDLRIEGESRHVQDTIIVGYHSLYEITPRITLFSDSRFLFEIEHMGHNIFRNASYVGNNEQAFKAYYVYLSSLINFCDLQSQRVYAFPELITKDYRSDRIKEIISPD